MTLLVASILAGASSIETHWLYGNKSLWGPIVGLVGQVPWAVTNWISGADGLWVAWVFTTVLHVRNLWKWSRHETSSDY